MKNTQQNTCQSRATLLHRLFTPIIFLLLCCVITESRATETLPDSKGKDFWFCFIPNFHTNFLSDEDVQRTDSLYIFVVAEKPCSITLDFRDYDGNNFRIDTAIRDARQVLTIGMPFYLKELIGFNVGGSVNRNVAQNGKIAQQSFHLTSTEEVTVYALNQAFTTSDAFLVLPTDANGTDYMVMSYNADLQINNRDASPTPSQYAVVATEDSTEIKFVNTSAIALDTLTYRTLNKGDVYLVQSLVNNESANDLTGSRITSTKPIAVFSGHQRVTIPLQLRQALVSRDMLVEQLPPINTWGRTALLTPYPLPTDATQIGQDRYRVIAAFDSTKVFVNGSQVTMLMTGQRFESDLDNAKTVRSNNPILVAQFKKTSGDVPPRGTQSDYKLSDPFMMLIPPAEQFLKSYRFINAQAYERDQQTRIVSRVYRQQYLTVVAPTTSISRILLDGTGIPAGRFLPIPSSVYSYATLPMADGVHAIEADTGIGIYVFGYGPANSYGYIGGMSFKRYDFPQITAKIACAKGRGVVYDTTLKDSRIVRVEPIRDSMFNVNISVLPFASPADSVVYDIQLADDTQDGWFWMEAEDQDALISRKRFEVPGFTLRSLDTLTGQLRPIPEILPVRGAVGRTYCRRYTYVNVGKFPQDINNVVVAGNTAAYTITGSFPTVVKPKDTISFDVCFRFDRDTVLSDTIQFVYPCTKRPAVLVQGMVKADTTRPMLLGTARPCGEKSVSILTDDGDFQTGIRAIQIADSTNCSVLYSLKSDSTRLQITIRDFRFDASYSIIVRDSAGNSTTIGDTVEGFTVMYEGVDSLNPQKRYDGIRYRETVCDTISIYNYGFRTKTFPVVGLTQSTLFSVPPHQFPFVLLPGERKKLAICYHIDEIPFTTTIQDNTLRWNDTLLIGDVCVSRPLPLTGDVVLDDYSGSLRCDIPISAINPYRPVILGVLSIRPNPVYENLTLGISSSDAANGVVVIRNMLGQEEYRREVPMSKGDNIISLSVDTLMAGTYTLHLDVNGTIRTSRVVIVR